MRPIHINNALGHIKKFEGLMVGESGFPYKTVIETIIIRNLRHDIIGMYEIKDGHIFPDKMAKSDLFYRNLFKGDFEKYFIR